MQVEFADALEPLGIATGAFLVLAGLGTIVGAPWETQATAAAAGVQVLGALLTAAVGVGIAWLSHTD